MEVINPIIMAGGRRAALPNQAQGGEITQGRAAYDHAGKVIAGELAPSAATLCEMRMMLGNHTQTIPIVRYSTIASASGPLLYILRPGAYTINNYELNTSLLQPYGLERGSFKRLLIAGNLRFTSSGNCMNFCGVYDKSYDASYMRCYYYISEKLYERSLPIVPGEENRAAVPMTSLYAAYCEAGILPLDDLRRSWRDYTTVNLYYMVLEE